MNETAATSAAAAAATAAAATDSTSVKLVIKACNQQYDDQIIDSDLSWTVKRLKMQISIIYPSKPPVAEQKLIYSGQLLKDTLVLKDVIRIYKDVYTQNHIFHLVHISKNSPSTTTTKNLNQKPKTTKTVTTTTTTANNTITTNMSTNSADVARRRLAADIQQFHQQQRQQQQHLQSLQRQEQERQQQGQIPFCMQPSFAQMMAMAAAANGMQCPQFDTNGTSTTTTTAATATATTTTTTTAATTASNNNAMPYNISGQYNMQAMVAQQVAMYNWMQQVYTQYMEQCMQHSRNSNAVQGTYPINNASNNVAPPVPASSQVDGVSSVVAPVQPQSQPQQQPQQQQQQEVQQPQPRFANIVQDEAENHDWLDSFFSMTRFAIFLTVLYFNSSMLRCLIVLFIGAVIYFYHIGTFRLPNERNNNNINRNNNAAAVAGGAGAGAGAGGLAGAGAGVGAGAGAGADAQQAHEQQQQLENPPNRPEAAAAGEPNLAAEPVLSSATNSVNPSNDNPMAEENNNSTSVISFIRTFVVTFFTSLLPETPAL